MRSLAIILPLKSKLSVKFQCFNTIDESIEILKNSYWKISIKLKDCKILYETQTASHLKEIIQPPATHHQIKSYYVFETKIFLTRYTELYRHLLSKCFKKVVLGRQEIGQCKCFSDTKQKHVCWKICTLKKFFACVLGAYYFQFQNSWDS